MSTGRFVRAPDDCDRPLIGIGGHLAMPPLPHHRAYGSVPRRFGGLSAHEFLHGQQPETLEAGIGEGAMQRARRTQAPRSFGLKMAALADRSGTLRRRSSW